MVIQQPQDESHPIKAHDEASRAKKKPPRYEGRRVNTDTRAREQSTLSKHMLEKVSVGLAIANSVQFFLRAMLRSISHRDDFLRKFIEGDFPSDGNIAGNIRMRISSRMVREWINWIREALYSYV